MKSITTSIYIIGKLFCVSVCVCVLFVFNQSILHDVRLIKKSYTYSHSWICQKLGLSYALIEIVQLTCFKT